MKRLTITQILILIPVLLFSGCWDQRIIEETGILLQIGIEPAPGDKILVTSVFPAFDSRFPNQDEIIAAEVNLLQEAIEKAKTITDKRVEGGKIQQILFAKEIAGQGIQELLEFFERDPLISPLAQIVIVDGSPKELLEKARTFGSKPRTVFYINRLLAKNANYLYVPKTSIYDFSICSLAPGLDPITPLLKVEPDGIRVMGSALFSAGRMVGQLDTQQTALLLAMMGRAPKAESVFIASGLEGESPFKKGAAFTIREGRRKIRLDLQDRRLAIDIHLDLLGVLDEYDQDLLDRAGPQEELEERLSKEIQENCFGILGYAQRLGSDPIGFGDLVRAKYYSAWKTMNWEEVYREATVNVAVKVEIRQFGLIK